ncbi:hypothetical protein [Mycolicibacterium celeriflavum]|uniref:hypothetical protein n=1 Tax=Mycolicibacterium celeriflavum TaxID=1249101 RepID=UPI003CF0B552
MGGFTVHDGATVRCTHGGQAEPNVTSERVRLAGQPAVLLPPPWTVRNCTPPSGPSCVTATWITGSVRVRSSGAPLVVDGGSSRCAPTGVSLRVITTQSRVRFE